MISSVGREFHVMVMCNVKMSMLDFALIQFIKVFIVKV